MASEPIIVALISVLSVLSAIILKDIVVDPVSQRYASRRMLVQMRLEKAYVPLEYLVFQVIEASDLQEQERLVQEIGAILQQYGHLLSESSLSALYTFCDDVNVGASMLQHRFFPECATLKQRFYRMWHSPHDPDDDHV